jgi:predicted ArsR family transcriptional regulator
MRLAARRGGVGVAELAAVAGCSPKSAQRTLAALTRDGLLTVTVPERKGQPLGSWKNVYRLNREVGK